MEVVPQQLRNIDTMALQLKIDKLIVFNKNASSQVFNIENLIKITGCKKLSSTHGLVKDYAAISVLM